MFHAVIEKNTPIYYAQKLKERGKVFKRVQEIITLYDNYFDHLPDVDMAESVVDFHMSIYEEFLGLIRLDVETKKLPSIPDKQIQAICEAVKDCISDLLTSKHPFSIYLDPPGIRKEPSTTPGVSGSLVCLRFYTSWSHMDAKRIHVGMNLLLMKDNGEVELTVSEHRSVHNFSILTS